jgi:hypothetical protein
MEKTTPKQHYVDNKEFLVAITAYRELRLAAEAAGDPKPRVTDYLGECFVKIANHLAYKSNFVNYTFRDEMILDGIENCITYIDNFNPEKSKNPFAYFTQITYYAFIRRIKKEKKHIDIKMKMITNMDFTDMFAEGQDTVGSEYLDYMKNQIDQANKHNEDHKETNSKIPKRKPKYLSDREAVDLAKEKIEALK